jgi:predicted HAD superfamily Cof-like phosphohydrolase
MTMPLDVKMFLNACDQQPTDENIDLYYELIKEEYKEFLDAVETGNNVEQLDACMDMIWVILGYCYMKGFDIKGAWQEVADSNLSKIDMNTGKVLRREDGKILKPDGWKPPKLNRYI